MKKDELHIHEETVSLRIEKNSTWANTWLFKLLSYHVYVVQITVRQDKPEDELALL